MTTRMMLRGQRVDPRYSSKVARMAQIPNPLKTKIPMGVSESFRRLNGLTDCIVRSGPAQNGIMQQLGSI